MQQTEPIIDLTTPRARRIVKMDCGTFRFRSSYDLTIEETQKVDRILPRFWELMVKENDRTPKETQEFLRVSDEVCRIGVIDGDLKQVGPAGRVVLADFFLDLCLRKNVRLKQVRDEISGAQRQLVGATSSPSSSGSTAERRGRGSRKPH